MKRILSLALAIVLSLSVFGTVSFADSSEEYTEGYYTFTLQSDEQTHVTYATIVDCDSTITGNVTIPTHLGSFKVIGIASGAFEDCALITSVTISGNVKSVGSVAFWDCENLESVIIKSPVESIGSRAFMGCTNLKNISISDTVTSIGSDAFSDTAYYKNSNNWESDVLYIDTHLIKAKNSITGSYKVKSGTITVAWCAFEDCTSLTGVTVPDSVKGIGMYAFADCDSIASMTLPFVGPWLNAPDEEYFSYIFGGSSDFDNDDYIPESLKTVVITKDTNIDEWAFYGCAYIESVSIPSTVNNIGDYAFRGCYKLKDLIIKNGVTSIGKWAFESCVLLDEVTVPDSVTSIGEGAFAYCDSLKKITLPFVGNDIDGTKDATFDYIFYNYVPESMKEVVITKAKEIGAWAFDDCSNIESITIPSSVKEIGNQAFDNCTGLTKINVMSLEAWCKISFYDSYANPLNYAKNLYINNQLATNIVIPSTIKNLNWHTFLNCASLESVVIQNGTSSIGHRTFYGCSNLKSVTLPTSLTTMIDSAFYGCSNLTSVYYMGSESQKSSIAFNGYNDSIKNAKWYYNACVGSASHRNGSDKITKATTKANGKTWKECSRCGKKNDEKTIYKIKTIELSKTKFTYNGKVQKPKVVVKDSKGKTIDSKYYTVSGLGNNKKVGKYTVTVTFKTKYSGTKKLSYVINPKKTSVSKVTKGKKSLKVTVKKQSTQVTGYQIQYSTSKKFTKPTTKTIKSYKTTSLTLKGLKAKKTYYVRVRTFKTVGKTKYYSDWSTSKKQKTK